MGELSIIYIYIYINISVKLMVVFTSLNKVITLHICDIYIYNVFLLNFNGSFIAGNG
jgi:hypothetical protein